MSRSADNNAPRLTKKIWLLYLFTRTLIPAMLDIADLALSRPSGEHRE
jgi:hypothetical protein